MISFLILLSFSFNSSLETKPKTIYKLTVKVTNIKELRGQLRVGMYGVKQEFLHLTDVYDSKVKSVSKNEESVVFELEEGEYAIGMMHDLNGNGKMEKNMFGIPKEPYGFSNNPGIWYRAPTFKECSFTLSEDKEIEIQL